MRKRLGTMPAAMVEVLSPATTEQADPSFVGRSDELRLFRDAFDRMLAGRRQLVTLLGEPGIGKTRCAEAFARVAEDQGALVLWGHCYEEPGSPPYWPWVQVLREYIGGSSPNEVRLVIGSAAADIAAIVPELAEDSHDRPQPFGVGVEASQARFRTFDAIGRFFAKAAQQVPLVLIIDNLHWADAPSLSLLEFLSQALARSRVLMLGTYRDREVSRKSPLLSTLGGVSRDCGVERIRLSGLGEEAIAALALTTLGEALPQAAIRAINQQTDGNPLFVIELLKVLLEESADAGLEPIAVRIPDGVREAIGRRLSRLSDRCNVLLSIASVLGRNFNATEIAAAAEEHVDTVIDNLEGAMRAGIVEALDDVPGGYRFTHSLIRETLYEEIPALERLRWHNRAADVLGALHGNALEPVLTRLAHHAYQAAPLGNADRAADFALRAAMHALRVYAYEEALVHCDQAIGALELNGGGNEERVAQACYLKSRAAFSLGDMEQCIAMLVKAGAHARALGNGELLIEITAQLSIATSDAPQAQYVPLLESAISLLPDADSAARAEAMTALAFALRSTDDRARRQSLVAEALAMAHRLGDPAALCQCFELAMLALRCDPETLEQRLALGQQYIEAARGSAKNELLGKAYGWQVLNLIEAGRAEEHEALLERYANLNVAQFGLFQYYIGAERIMLALLRGEWDELEAHIEALLETGMKTRPADAEGVYGAQMFVLHRDRGHLLSLEPIVRGIVENGSFRAWRPGLMLICAEIGLLAEARLELERLAADDFAFPKDEMYVACLVFSAETCCRLSETRCAAKLYERLEPYADQTANHPRVACFGSTQLYLGMLAATIGESDAAQRHLELAVERNRAMRAWPWLARAQFQYGAFLLARGASTEQEAARKLLRDAEQLAGRLGMEALLKEIGVLLRGSGAESALPDGLTAREVDVLQLISMGRSNRDISIVLSISLNTVATHVRNILNKTHSANRTEAAAYAIHHELQAPHPHFGKEAADNEGGKAHGTVPDRA